jgi:hypothetical protein
MTGPKPPESVIVSADVAFHFYTETFAPTTTNEPRLPFQVFGRLLLDDHDKFIDLRAQDTPREDVAA